MNDTTEIKSCRVCLATGLKMYDMYTYQLQHVYENLINTTITFPDDLPRHICFYCTSLLLKFAKFQKKCLQTQDQLRNSASKYNELTIEETKIIDIKIESVNPPYSIFHLYSLEIPGIKIEEEYTYCDNYMFVDDKNDYTNDNNEHMNDKNDYTDDNNEQMIDKNDYTDDNNDADDNKLCINDNNVDSDILNESVNDIKNDTIIVDTKDNKSLHNDSEEINSDEEPLSKKKSKINKVKKKRMRDWIVESGKADVDMIILSKEQQIKEIEDRKTSYNYLNSYYKCDYCYKGFLTESTFRNHMQRHDLASGPIVCDVCNTRWPDMRSMRAHALISHIRKYVCRLCSNVSKNLYKAREHHNWHGGFKFVCNICGSVFSKSTTHLTHLRTQHASQHKHACNECGDVFISDVGLAMHKKKAHRDNTQFQCPSCNVQFAKKEALAKHNGSELSCSGSKLKPCVKCGENFDDDVSLKLHLKKHLKDDAVDCQFCNRSFCNERTFSAHYQRFHVGKLKRDRYHPERRRDLVCEVCGFKCVTKTMLQYHQRTHTGEKPHQCTECPKSFRIFQSLQIHLRTHTGECPFKCTQCPKAFKHKAGLNRHTRVHTGAKPYSCPHCGKSFSQSNSMKLHVSTVHLKMPAPYKNRIKNRPMNNTVETV